MRPGLRTGPVEAPVRGIVDAEKARIIVRAVDGLGVDHGDLVAPEVRERAEEHLVDLAARFDAPTLTRLAKRLVEVVCPEAADAAEGTKLEAEEAASRRTAYLQIRDHGDGTSSGSFKVPTVHPELFRTVLDELTPPRMLGDGRLDPETGKPRSTSALRGQRLLTLRRHHRGLRGLPAGAGAPRPSLRRHSCAGMSHSALRRSPELAATLGPPALLPKALRP